MRLVVAADFKLHDTTDSFEFGQNVFVERLELLVELRVLKLQRQICNSSQQNTMVYCCLHHMQPLNRQLLVPPTSLP